MTSIPGVDYAWSHPGGAALAAAGKRFAARYLSADPKKNLGRAEAEDLAAHGISSVVVWESTATRPLAGRAAGISDAQTAAKQATAAGMPPSRPIYFAVDFDATAAQMPTVLAYLDGAASVLGRARTGVYGGIRTVQAALDGGHAAWAWQTRAWSAGRWDPRAHIRQGTTAVIGGVSCDLNTATVADYGQWTPGRTPDLEDTVPLTDAEIAKVAAASAAATRDAILNRLTDDPTTSDDSTKRLLAILWDTGKNSAQANANVVKVLAQVAGLNATVAALAKGGGLTAEQITAASEAGARAALAELGDALTTPKES
jgi:hypothetical protein